MLTRVQNKLRGGANFVLAPCHLPTSTSLLTCQTLWVEMEPLGDNGLMRSSPIKLSRQQGQGNISALMRVQNELQVGPNFDLALCHPPTSTSLLSCLTLGWRLNRAMTTDCCAPRPSNQRASRGWATSSFKRALATQLKQGSKLLPVSLSPFQPRFGWISRTQSWEFDARACVIDRASSCGEGQVGASSAGFVVIPNNERCLTTTSKDSSSRW